MGDVTQILSAVAAGDPQAARTLLPLVYNALRRLAAEKLAQEAAGRTFQPTDLVHEAYLRLVGTAQVQSWNSRGHFFAAAAEAMRRLLVEAARRRQTLKRGSGQVRQELEESHLVVAEPPEELLEVHEALDRLADHNPAQAELVKLRYFAGFTLAEAARLLGISETTAGRWWAYARAWLYREILRLGV